MLQGRNKILQLKMPRDVELPGFERLRPYQRVDVNFLSKLPSGALFNQQRTGKSPSIISLFKLKNFKKIVLVVPAGLILSWKKEVEEWYEGIKVFAIKGSKKQREKIYQTLSELESYALIMSYDTLKLKNELDSLLAHSCVVQFDAVAVDEIHNIRNRKSQRTLAVNALGKLAKHRYGLTGTPSVSRGYDVFSILHFLFPERFSSYWSFLERYFEMKTEFFSGTKQPTGKYIRQEELEDILAMISTNRKRKEVMEWLPDKTYMTIEVEMSAKQRKAYVDMLETFIVEEDGKIISDASSVLAQLTRLRQICLSPHLLNIKAPSAKEDFLLEWLQDNPEPVIIFSQFTSYLKQLAETIEEEVVMIHGEMSGKQKQESVEHFQSGKTRILLANIEAAGTGFTLDRAETTVFLDKHWNPASNLQAEDRMVPVSKERIHKMTVISLVASDSYDEKLDLILQHKHNVTEIINSGGLRAIDRLYKELSHAQIPSISV
jgi:SNF2 family DNA or RNA helicase